MEKVDIFLGKKISENEKLDFKRPKLVFRMMKLLILFATTGFPTKKPDGRVYEKDKQ